MEPKQVGEVAPTSIHQGLNELVMSLPTLEAGSAAWWLDVVVAVVVFVLAAAAAVLPFVEVSRSLGSCAQRCCT